MPRSNTPDAAESNAGDEFHVLWAMRKSLELLNVNDDGLKALSVEGITQKDEERLTDKDAVLGVDLTEYYGGRDFAAATKVYISQLKYSTRNATKNWTPSELYTGKTHKWQGSIIHRLASIFHDFYISQTRDEILKKLTIKLVSNRPASRDIQNALALAHNKIKTSGRIATVGALIKGMPKKSADILRIFSSAAGLKGQEYVDFITLFDLADCNTDSRYNLKKKLIEGIIQTGNIDVRKEYNELYQLVKEKTLPEGQNSKTLIITDILYTFGFSDFSELFPARSFLQTPPHLIERDQLRNIVDLIEDPSTKLMLLHAGAGMGKSTMTELILRNIHKAHCAIVFDCYGEGAYLNSDDKRHKPENAFLQLSNELALKSGSPFLITRGQPNDAYLRAFQKRIRIAVQLLRKINPISEVILIIDAADNSAHGAEQYQEHSFVQDLLSMSIPEGCKIVVTSRTARIGLLKLPATYKAVEIEAFSFAETKQFLQPSFPDLTDEEIEEFRKMTKCTPRAMAYSLDIPGDILKEKMIPLEPDGKSIEDIFKLLIDEATKRSGDKQAISDFLESLIHLPRPVPLTYISRVSNLSAAQLKDIQTDLWRGVINKNEHFSFRDEDFENFLRNEYPRTDSINKKIAEAFLSNANTDEYASVHLGMALFNAGMGDRLQTIVLEKEYLQLPADPIKNKDVQVERTRLAMKISGERNNKLNLIKLQMVAAEAAKTNSVLEQILLDKAELATSYGDLQMNQRLYFQLGNPSWFGHVHFRSAAIYSRNLSTHDLARQHLSKADDWMEYSRRLPANEQHDFSISDRDIAYGAEAVLNIAGPASCIEWLGGWKPRDAVYRASEILLHNVIESSGKAKAKKWFRGISLDPIYELLITRVFFEYGMKPPFILEKSLKHFDSIELIASKTSSKLYKDILAFCEYALQQGIGFEEIKPWLLLISIEKPRYVPSFYEHSFGNLGEEKYLMDMMFRKECLMAFFEERSLTPSDFYHPSLVSKLKEREHQYDQYSDQERRKFDSMYKILLPIYELRIAYLLKTMSAKKLQAKLNSLLEAVRRDYEMQYLHKLGFEQMLKFMAVRLSDIAIFKYSETVIDSISDAFSSGQENNIALYLGLARKVSGFSNYHRTVLNLLKKVEEAIEMLTLPGDEQLGHFTEATLIAGRISLATGKHYFDKMVASSSVIDTEGQQQISAVSKMIGTEQNWSNPKLAYELARFVEYTYESLKGFDHFPWHHAVPAIARLDAASAFASACRWDHRGILDYQEHFIELIEPRNRSGFFDPYSGGGDSPG